VCEREREREKECSSQVVLFMCVCEERERKREREEREKVGRMDQIFAKLHCEHDFNPNFYSACIIEFITAIL